MNILVTGGAGFIGSAVVRYLINNTQDNVLVIDRLTYAGNLDSLQDVSSSSRYRFSHTDINNRQAIDALLADFQPEAIMHLAAESHVDRSINGPAEFIQTNIVGTYTLLEATREWWCKLPANKRAIFRFHHISTDEVFGDLGDSGLFFNERTAYAPSSPYSASKAASDHLVRAWHRTYELPVIVTNCSNNYGPCQYPEKLIPLMILNALAGKALPVYGDGRQIRDWLYVEDHARALYQVVTRGVPGETYNVGGHNEKRNIDVITTLCHILDESMCDKPAGINHFDSLITHIADRPGHDTRYAIDASKIERELGWTPQESFESGIRKTVNWYLNNRPWWQRILDGHRDHQ